MKPKVIIIDYQMSNLFSVKHACDDACLEGRISSDLKELMRADAAILPGVGAFGDAMNNLHRLGLISGIRDFILSGRPFFGICLGMQLLFSESEEFGRHSGLGVIKGRVVPFPKINLHGQKIKVPQIGWNKIYVPDDKINRWRFSPLKNNTDRDFMYFVHSFCVKPTDPRVTLSLTNYEGIEYCSSIMSQNIFAVQFHPEKSGEAGLKIYHNWKKIIYEKTKN